MIISSLKNTLVRPALWVAAVSTLGLTGACRDYLDVEPLSSTDPAFVFSSLSGASSALTGAYDLLSGDASYGQRLNTYYTYDSDDMVASGGATVDNGRRGIARYTLDANNTELIQPFQALYQGVERANVCIANIPKSPLYDGGTPTEQATLRSYYGQALTLRAQYLFELIRNWGDVPVSYQPASATADLNLPNTDRDATYERLLADLAEAAPLVEWATPGSDEHITRGAVKALRARIALYRGGFALRADGQVRRGSNYQQYYEIARQECADIMASNKHALIPSFERLFRNVNELKVDPTEIMFEVANGGSSSNSFSNSKLGYFTGPKIDASTPYGQAGPGVYVLPTYFYAFDTLDTRRDVSITYYEIKFPNSKVPVRLNALTDGKFRRDWRQPLLPGTLQYLNYNWPLIRYADVLLMFAEVQSELAGPTAAFQGFTPVAMLEQVRRRAFRAGASIGTTPTDKDAFFTTLMREREFEFGGEGIRKYDLKRWNLLGARLDSTRKALARLGADSAHLPAIIYYKPVGTEMQITSLYRPALASPPPGFRRASEGGGRWLRDISATFASYPGKGFQTGKSELLPYPQLAIENNVNLKQNPGY